jgi:hypothetical protein
VAPAPAAPAPVTSAAVLAAVPVDDLELALQGLSEQDISRLLDEVEGTGV